MSAILPLKPTCSSVVFDGPVFLRVAMCGCGTCSKVTLTGSLLAGECGRKEARLDRRTGLRPSSVDHAGLRSTRMFPYRSAECLGAPACRTRPACRWSSGRSPGPLTCPADGAGRARHHNATRVKDGRGGGIRTHDLVLPKHVPCR